MLKGTKHSEEAKKKMSLTKKGKHYNPEYEFKKGHPSPKYWLGKKISEETKMKLSQASKRMHSNPELHIRVIRPLLEHNKSIKKYYSEAEKKKGDKILQEEKRMKVLIHYSGNPPKCARCGFSDVRALTIDHIVGGGGKHRREIHRRIENWIIDNNFPEGYQVLCMNCNLIKKLENKEF